jgi:hypothetical protein
MNPVRPLQCYENFNLERARMFYTDCTNNLKVSEV